jgi:DNA-binding response OmpR family regulator
VRVLLADDERLLADTVADGLRKLAMAVDVCYDGEAAMERLGVNRYDVAVLDRDMPKATGDEVCRWMVGEALGTRILILTAASGIRDRVDGLGLGADDYLTKPFELEELLARLRALIRRGHEIKDPIIRVHDLEIDTTARIVKRSGQAIHLTPREFALLQFLAFHRGKVVSRSMIWEHLYDEHDANTSNVVDVYIRYLRNKIDKDFEMPLILTRWGEGYLLRGEE